MKYTPNIDKLQNIISQGNYALIDEFEEEMIGKLLEKETTAMIICGCRSLIRNAFYMTLAMYGKDADILHFCTIILNNNGEGRHICTTAMRKRVNEVTLCKTRRVAEYFLEVYYPESYQKKKTEEFTYCKPVRYLCELIIDTKLIIDNALCFSELEAIENEKIIKEVSYDESFYELKIDDTPLKEIINEDTANMFDCDIDTIEDDSEWLDFDFGDILG